MRGGPHHHVTNSRVTSVTSLRAHQSAMTACFGFRRKINRTAFWDFCNTICQERPSPASFDHPIRAKEELGSSFTVTGASPARDLLPASAGSEISFRNG